MADDRTERILDAAYACFARHGVRRTTMDDIAAAAEMSRPAVYVYVRNKDDAFRRLATRLFDRALAQARTAATAPVDAPLAERLHAVLAVKLELTLQLWRDSPHAAELLDEGARLSGDLVERFTDALRELATEVVAVAQASGEVALHSLPPAEVVDIALALTRSLEADLTDPDLPRRRLRRGIDLLVAGLRCG
ncbi:MAG TPA: helix-turn-helix domain-containing protein [Pseudonocardiaceae bacterium]